MAGTRSAIEKICAGCGAPFRPWKGREATSTCCSAQCFGTADSRRRMAADPIAYFWSHVEKRGPDECWPWTGPKGTRRAGTAYGAVCIQNRKIFAHRVSWEIANGPIPEGLCVLHRCDNPPCVNPGHLFIGTDADNVADMMAKGRNTKLPIRRGEDHRCARLVAAQVLAIRSDQRPYKSIAADYGVSPETIGAIKHRRNWRHI